MFNIYYLKKLYSCNEGVAAVEFALIVPVLILIVMGVIDYGTFINNKIKIQNLSRTAAEYVVQGGDPTNVEVNIIDTSKFYIDSQNAGTSLNVTTNNFCECAGGSEVSCGTTCSAQGDYLRNYFEVTIDATYSPMFVYPGILDSIKITGYSHIQYNK